MINFFYFLFLFLFFYAVSYLQDKAGLYKKFLYTDLQSKISRSLNASFVFCENIKFIAFQPYSVWMTCMRQGILNHTFCIAVSQE